MLKYALPILPTACFLFATQVAHAETATSSASAQVVRFSPQEPRVGDVVMVYVNSVDPAVTEAKAEAFGYRIPLFRVSERELRGVIGVPMDLAPRSHLFTAHLPSRTVRSWVNVKNRDWEHSELSVSRRFTRKRSKSLRRRIRRESKRWAKMWDPDATPPAFVGPLTRPVTGEVTAVFGTKRIFNGKTKSRHYGLDLNGKRGDPIVAVQRGRVVYSAMRFTSGGTIVIDHGNGLFTAYFHMSRRIKKEGAWVKAGERLGDVGATGRVTGPHLHLAVLVRQTQIRENKKDRVRGIYVDPEAFLNLEFEGTDGYMAKPTKHAHNRRR